MHTLRSPRYEIKLRCEPQDLEQIHAWVRLHPAHWRVVYPSRQVNNIYFDTYDYKSLNENLGGVGTRYKLRLRWYGPRLETVTRPRLELKSKEGAVGWKEVCLFEQHPESDSLSLDLTRQPWCDLRQAIRNAALDDRADLWLAQFAFPVLINHYQRAYYATPDQTVRLTIDSQLSVYDQRFSAQPNLDRPAPIVDCVVVEFKADRAFYPRLVELLSGFPVRTDRYSKYVQGMLAAPDFNNMGLL